MKKILAILALLPLIASTQVRVASPAKHTDEAKKFQYDSTYNCPLIYAEQCRGQELFLMPNKQLLGLGFQQINDKGVPQRVEMGNHVGHVFDVVDVINGKEYVGAKLVLRDKETQEEFLYRFPESGAVWPFMTLGYKAKYENKHKGQQYVVGIIKPQHDFNTGEPIGTLNGTVWTFNEMLSSEDGKIIYLFTDDMGRAIALDEFWLKQMHPKKDLDIYISMYGKEIVETAVQGTLVVGMPSDLVRIAKGNPDKINSSSYGEQWVYKHQYIYIKDGKVSGWN